jgi:hypothetical protein
LAGDAKPATMSPAARTVPAMLAVVRVFIRSLLDLSMVDDRHCRRWKVGVAPGRCLVT